MEARAQLVLVLVIVAPWMRAGHPNNGKATTPKLDDAILFKK